MIRIALISDLESVLQITHDTISEIYAHYYAGGVVDFFLKHHSRDNVISDIENGIVWLLEKEGCTVGTVTIKENAVYRLFILPGYQSRGYGSQLMDFAETKIAEQFSYVHIDSSLAAKEMYLKRGYHEKKTCRILTDNGDILIYDEMEKRVNKPTGSRTGGLGSQKMILSDKMQVENLIENIETNLEITRKQIVDILLKREARDALATIKFDKTSFDPLSGEQINFIEMLNQAYSDLVVLKAVEDLIGRYPGKEFKLNMGPQRGSDIESIDNEVVAECFATVTAFNNQKIKKDSEKLMQIREDVNRYIYFYSREDSANRINTFTEKYKEIKYVRIEAF